MNDPCICESRTAEICCPVDKKLRDKWLNDLKKEHESVKKDSFEIAKKIKLFSNPTRLQILLMLQQRENCLDEIARKLLITKPGLSYHLKLLKKHGMICVRKRSRFAFYALSRNGDRALMAMGKL